MMRVGGSIFSKFCRREISSSGSRHNFSSSSFDEITNVDDAIAKILASLMLNGIFAYGAYKFAHYKSPYDPQKYASNQEAMVRKDKLLNDKCKALEKKEALLGQLEAQRKKEMKKKREAFKQKLKKTNEDLQVLTKRRR